MKTLCKRIVATMSAVVMLSAIAIMPSYAENEESILIRCIDQCTGDNAYLQQHWATEGAIGMMYTDPSMKVTGNFDLMIYFHIYFLLEFLFHLHRLKLCFCCMYIRLCTKFLFLSYIFLCLQLYHLV